MTGCSCFIGVSVGAHDNNSGAEKQTAALGNLLDLGPQQLRCREGLPGPAKTQTQSLDVVFGQRPCPTQRRRTPHALLAERVGSTENAPTEAISQNCISHRSTCEAAP